MDWFPYQARAEAIQSAIANWANEHDRNVAIRTIAVAFALDEKDINIFVGRVVSDASNM
jgi:Skp family chaperone for outer membrane proteins